MGRPDLEVFETAAAAAAADDNETTQHLPPASCAFPSPPSLTDLLSSPSLCPTPTAGIPSDDALLDSRILPTMPDDVVQNSPSSPSPTTASQVDSFPPSRFVVGGPLAIVPTIAPPRTLSSTAREGPGLRLPSFQQLGIASPYSNGVGNAEASGLVHDHPTLPHPRDSLYDRLPCVDTRQDAIGRGKGNSRPIQSPVYHYIDTITPPVDPGRILWDPQPPVQTAGTCSPHRDAASGAERSDRVTNIEQTDRPDVVFPHQEQEASSDLTNEGDQPWIAGALDVLLSNLRVTSKPIGSLKVLSHALPSTSTTGHIFAKVINAIHELTPASPTTPTTWINVFHAIPGRFNLADLPTSPPSTPGPAIGGEDYFTQKTFDSAVHISDYQVASPMLPRSPRPVVPPSSIDVSIVERYIPPSSSIEFAEMFDPNGSSILVDRLVELSPNDGSLLFIYPTKQGGEIFMREYLSPILDPVLRTMGVVHGISSNVCSAIGSMNTVDEMLDHDSLNRRMTALCAKLTQQNTAAQRLHGRRPRYAVAYAARRVVKFPRGVWAREWWAKQEKTRIKEVLAHHSRDAEARRMSNDFASQSTTSAVLVQNVLDQVSGKEAQETETPGKGIEVSVFVIRRSQ